MVIRALLSQHPAVEPAELVQPWSFATYKQLAIDAEQPDVTGVREWDHIQLLGPGQEARRDKLPYWGETVGMQVSLHDSHAHTELVLRTVPLTYMLGVRRY